MQRTIISSYLTKDLKGSVKNCYHEHLLHFFFSFNFQWDSPKNVENCHSQCWHWGDFCNCRICKHEISGKFVLKELQAGAKRAAWWVYAHLSVTKDFGEIILP